MPAERDASTNYLLFDHRKRAHSASQNANPVDIDVHTKAE